MKTTIQWTAVLAVAGALAFAGWWIYSYDKGSLPLSSESDMSAGQDLNADEGAAVDNTAQQRPSDSPIVDIPEHLTSAFWESAAPENLAEKLKSVSNPNEVRPDTGQNMLHLLVLYGKRPEMISQLISAGVDFKLKDRQHNGTSATPLIHLAGRGPDSLPFVKELLKYDTDVNGYGDIFYEGVLYKANPLSRAAFHRMPAEGVRLLLEKGVDPNSVINNNVTALMLAVMPSPDGPVDPASIQAFLDHKADITAQDAGGKTAYDYMMENTQIPKTIFKALAEKLKPEQ